MHACCELSSCIITKCIYFIMPLKNKKKHRKKNVMKNQFPNIDFITKCSFEIQT